jgi:dienelactone hydrolase
MKVDDIQTPLLVLVGEKDNICHPYLCRSMLPLNSASHELVLKLYPEAHHAFDFEGTDSEIAWDFRFGFKYLYHPEAAKDAAIRVRGFLDKYLK